ncbi:MAG: hypothetical protein IPP57_26045 [Candidatus Obscuribacter sp.]|nr:hypothetical protein [Candidatus Obscuribacter sp.]
MISCGPSRNLSFVSRGLVLDKALPLTIVGLIKILPRNATISPPHDTKSAWRRAPLFNRY